MTCHLLPRTDAVILTVTIILLDLLLLSVLILMTILLLHVDLLQTITSMNLAAAVLLLRLLIRFRNPILIIRPWGLIALVLPRLASAQCLPVVDMMDPKPINPILVDTIDVGMGLLILAPILLHLDQIVEDLPLLQMLAIKLPRF
jgi:hypothetical protein